MPRSDDVPPARASLLHELGRAAVRSAAGDGRPEELMRLAGDPLLLRAFLSRPEHPADGHWRSPGPGVPFAGLAQKAPTEAPSPSACRYGQREALLAPSLFPERFDASGEDWSAPEDTGGVAGHDGAARWLPAVAGLALVLGLLCLLLALSV